MAEPRPSTTPDTRRRPPDAPRIWTVTELSREVRALLETAFPDVWVEGEVSNPKLYPSGHLYFDLKDAESVISAVMFGVGRFQLRFELQQGLEVLVRARLSSYPRTSKYQLVVSEIQPREMGALQLAFEQLKARLAAEGLFDAARKRPIPKYPAQVGVVTSLEGAAIRDILSVLQRRFAGLHIVIHPVRVQGEGAAEEIAQAIQTLNAEFPELEALLVGRGGGSLEDLWAFNEEAVARAIAASRIPVISCVGHETDFTIADFVADLRAPTPSAAAEMVVQNREELVRHLRQVTARLLGSLSYRLALAKQRLGAALENRFLRRPAALYEDRARELDDLERRLLETLGRWVQAHRSRLRLAAGKLDALSPLAVLSRGYAIVFKLPEERAVRRAADVVPGDRLRVRVQEGEFFSRVIPAQAAAG